MSKPNPWTEIEKHYISLNDHGWAHDRLLELVRHIQSNYTANRLFACTSLDTLIISADEDIERRKDTLHIDFERETQKWKFQYFAQPYKEPEFVRQYEAELGVDKFDNFIKMIGW